MDDPLAWLADIEEADASFVSADSQAIDELVSPIVFAALSSRCRRNHMIGNRKCELGRGNLEASLFEFVKRAWPTQIMNQVAINM
jgi:hypothetical protein